uniref:Si:dkey-165a24.9 n=1 Tax=Nothobranchius furzeri TaxID=105023 RepID=A0A8C6NHZ8_NOTFU
LCPSIITETTQLQGGTDRGRVCVFVLQQKGVLLLQDVAFKSEEVRLTCIYGVIFSLGLPSNLLSLWGLYHLGRSGGGGCQLVFILNLLLSDLLQLLTLPLWILYLQGSHRWPYGRLTCELVGYVFYVNVYASVMFLCLIALDRCLAIVYPLSSRRVRRVRVAAVLGVAVWILTFLFCLSGLLPSVFDSDRLLCLEKYPVINFQNYISPTLSNHERNKIVGILMVITFNFIVVFGPYHLVGGYRFVSLLGTEEPCGFEQSIFLVYRLCYGLTSLNTLLDPLFYIFLCPDARLELQRSLSCLRPGQNNNHKNIGMSTMSHLDSRRLNGPRHNTLVAI